MGRSAKDSAEVIPKPLSVHIAVWILWVLTVLEFAYAVAVFRILYAEYPLADPRYEYIVVALMILFNSVLILKASAGRNWARIIILLWYLDTLRVYFTPQDYQRPELSFTFELLGPIGMVLCFVALLLLFTPPGSRWFRKRKKPTPQTDR